MSDPEVEQTLQSRPLVGVAPKAKPLLKWAGGKTQLLPELDKVFPERCSTYFEPFVGGAAAFFHMAGRFEQAVLNDWNPELVNLYTQVRDNPIWVMWNIDAQKEMGLSRESYNRLRAQDPGDFEHPWYWASRMIYLNKAGFNGLYRQNKAGQFNVPWGKRTEVNFYDRENVLACQEALKKAKITQGDFTACTQSARPGDLVYMDPPYVPLSSTSNFKSYTKNGFSLDDQTRVRDEFVRLVEAGVHVVVSNSDTPEIRELYDGYDIRTVQARRNINSKGSSRGPVNEVLVVGAP